MEKSTGPSIEPWVTPKEMGPEDEDEFLTETLKGLLNKYKLNQFKAEPETLAYNVICGVIYCIEYYIEKLKDGAFGGWRIFEEEEFFFWLKTFPPTQF